MEKAKQRTRGLTELIEKLLDLSRIESGKVYVDIKDVNVEEFLKERFEDWKDQTEIKKTKKIVLNLGVGEDFTVKVDPRALGIMFNNLVNNAIKYTPEGGEIFISTSKKGNIGLISVKDTGIGIPKQEQDKIFNRFYRVKEDSTKDIPGTGLGLAMVKGIVDDLGGDIQVISEEGMGTTFVVKIPLA